MAPQSTDADFIQWNVQKAEGNSQSFHSANTVCGGCGMKKEENK